MKTVSTYVVDFAAKAAPRPTSAPRVPRVARLLALAHRVDRLIRAGELEDLAEAARLCGITRARATQISNLLLLAPAIQAEILDLEVAAGRDTVTERALRPIVAEPEWERQVAMWKRLR